MNTARVKWVTSPLVALLAIVLLAAPPAPQCSEAQSAQPVLDGQYYAVTCPEGALTVTARAGQAAPALGPASVRKINRAWRLVVGGQGYGIVVRGR